MDINRPREPKCLNLFGKFGTKSTYYVQKWTFARVKFFHNQKKKKITGTCIKTRTATKHIINHSENNYPCFGILFMNLHKPTQFCNNFSNETNGECVLYKVVTIQKWSAVLQCAMKILCGFSKKRRFCLCKFTSRKTWMA